MNFVNQAYAQLVDLFRSLTPGAARITAALLLVAVVVSLAYLFHLQTSGAEEYLFGGREYNHAELGAMEAAFAKAGLAKSEIVGNRMRVPRGQKDKYLASLVEANALPKDFNDALEQALKSENPFSSGRSFEARLQNAKQKELSLILSKMNGIRLASVQFDEISKGFPRTKERRALVSVQPEGTAPLEEDRVKTIRMAVAAAFAGLEPANVTLADLGSGTVHSGVSGSGQPGSESPYNEHKVLYERNMKRKITDRLAMYPGVVVEVNVELNPELESHTQGLKYDAKAIPMTSTDSVEETTSTAPGTAGRPGAVANGVGGSNAAAQVASATTGAQSQSTKTRNDQRNITGHEQTTVRKVGLTPKRVTASIAVPTSYFEKVWRTLNPAAPGASPKPPDPAELRRIEDDTRSQIEKAVVSLFPPVELGTDKYPLVTVTTFTDLPRPVETPPGLADNATSWLAGNWQTLALVVVGLFSLVMLRGMLKPGPQAATPPAVEGLPLPQPTADAEEEAGQSEGSPAKKRRFRSSGGASLRDELTDMVKEDPDAAANVLRSWIGEAA